MPRLCPALETIVLSAIGIGLSGSGGSPSSVRLRGRSGPRSGSRSAPVPTSHSYTNLWVGAAAFVVGLAVLIWWTGRPIDSKSSPPLNIPSAGDGKPKSRGDLPGPGVLPPAERNTFFVTADPTQQAAAAGRTDIVPTLGEALARADANSRQPAASRTDPIGAISSTQLFFIVPLDDCSGSLLVGRRTRTWDGVMVNPSGSFSSVTTESIPSSTNRSRTRWASVTFSAM